MKVDWPQSERPEDFFFYRSNCDVRDFQRSPWNKLGNQGRLLHRGQARDCQSSRAEKTSEPPSSNCFGDFDQHIRRGPRSWRRTQGRRLLSLHRLRDCQSSYLRSTLNRFELSRRDQRRPRQRFYSLATKEDFAGEQVRDCFNLRVLRRHSTAELHGEISDAVFLQALANQPIDSCWGQVRDWRQCFVREK